MAVEVRCLLLRGRFERDDGVELFEVSHPGLQVACADQVDLVEDEDEALGLRLVALEGRDDGALDGGVAAAERVARVEYLQ